MKTVIILVLTLFTVGCANQSRTDYYAAVKNAAESHSRVNTARYEALTQMANRASRDGDKGAATAAIMAIALTRNEAVRPQFIEDSALKWAQVLAPTLTAVGIGLIQADVSKNASNNSKDISINAQDNNAQTELGNQVLVGSIVATGAAAAGASTEVVIEGFNALGDSNDTLANVATTAITENGTLADTAITNVVDIATTGYSEIGTIVEGNNDLTLDIISYEEPVIVPIP